MGKILDAVIQFLKEDKWTFTQLEGKTVLRMRYGGKNGEWTCYADAVEDREIFLFNCYYAVTVPEDKRQAMADFLTRANWGLRVGNFEMDFRDGQVGFKTSIDVKDDRLTSPLVEHVIYWNLHMMDRYLPGVMAIIYGGASPEKAIADVEGSTR